MKRNLLLNAKIFRTHLLIVAIVASVFHVTAQTAVQQGVYAPDGIMDLMETVNRNWMLNGKNEQIEGSPYLKEEFEPGEIQLKDNTTIPEVPMRYNIYNDQIEFQYKEKTYNIGNKNLVENIKIGTDVFIVEMYETINGERFGFFSLLADGETRLLAKYEMELTDKVPAKALRDPEPRKFVRENDVYYVKIGQQRIYAFGNVKKLIAYLGDHEEELEAFAKKEKISARNPDELAKLINYYNSL